MDDEHVVNLEHILPENPQDSWPGITPEIASAFFRRIGNLVLLQAKANSLLGNSPFHEKKNVLQASSFLLTKAVGNYSKWGVDEIRDRQEGLAKLAVLTWPITKF